MFSSGLALRALGRIAIAQRNFAEAELKLSRALATFTECGAAFEAARTRADLAALFAGNLDSKAARDHLAAALMGFKQARAPRRIAEARRTARAHEKPRAATARHHGRSGDGIVRPQRDEFDPLIAP
jgi:hypothetical protein